MLGECWRDWQMSEFEKWNISNSSRCYLCDKTHIEDHRKEGWKAALEWVLQKGESCNYINEPWDDIKKELKIIENE